MPSRSSEEELLSSQEPNDKHPKRVYSYLFTSYDPETLIEVEDRVSFVGEKEIFYKSHPNFDWTIFFPVESQWC